MKINFAGLTALWAFCLFAGCATENGQLEAVNKDWNQLIRASHIYPIYPLTQDLQPGDIFFVSTDIEDLSPWTEKGYIKLDHLIARVYPSGYSNFYAKSFATDANHLPKHWLKDNSWTNAPIAAFPSYTFTVKQGGGMNVALPIQGIPVGLGLMGAKQASGYVTIADAHTYGIDELTLKRQAAEFIDQNWEELLDEIPAGAPVDKIYYLQVVSRVYTTSRVAVSMFHDSASGGSAFGGAPKNVTIPGLETTNAAANYTNLMDAVNRNLETPVPTAANPSGVLPGGTIKFTSVSARSLSLQESFPKPLVIGYTGFSIPISITGLASAAVGEQIPVRAVSIQRALKEQQKAK